MRKGSCKNFNGRMNPRPVRLVMNKISELKEAIKKIKELSTEISNNHILGLGARLKSRRVEFGFTQIHIGEIVGLSRTSIVQIENSKQNLSVESLVKLCNVLETTPNYLLGFSEE